MHHAAITQIENPGPAAVGARWRTVFVAAMVLGAVAFTAGILTDAERAFHNYLVCFFLFLGFGLFGLFFTAIHHAVNAKWWIVTRRVAEGFTAYLPLAIVLFSGIMAGLRFIYPWAEGEIAGDPGKFTWLSPTWFNLRGYLFLVIWAIFARKLTSLSLEQDETGDPRLSRKMVIWSIVFLPVFAGTFSVTCFDLLMSLQPKWYSTLFAVYGFAGLFQSGIAALIIVFILMKRGPLAQVATPSHVKDIGTLLFAFTIFMCYIGFSQYMLIWYANLPEETVFFLRRQEGGWEYLFVALPVLKFAIPFLGLLSQALKKNEKWLMAVSAVVIVGQYVDLYWLVMPSYSDILIPIGWMEIGIFLMFAGLFALSVSRFYARHPVLAARDPRILESANWRFWE
ncbi:molybdopterin oxidoreductase [bacterium]|nr:molybdopterin oxidoreductase [bacterium]MBU1982955.1 molybdopterin oxidoreductase [bacterium]